MAKKSQNLVKVPRTKFYSILTTYPPRVDKHGHSTYNLYFVIWSLEDFLLTIYPPLLVHVIIECTLNTKVFVLRSNNMYLENVVCILGEKYTKPLVPNQQQKHTWCVEMKSEVAFIFSRNFRATAVLRRGNVSNFSCHSHSALCNVYPVALDRTKR